MGDLAGGRWRCSARRGSCAETARQALARTDINTGTARDNFYTRASAINQSAFGLSYCLLRIRGIAKFVKLPREMALPRLRLSATESHLNPATPQGCNIS